MDSLCKTHPLSVSMAFSVLVSDLCIYYECFIDSKFVGYGVEIDMPSKIEVT